MLLLLIGYWQFQRRKKLIFYFLTGGESNNPHLLIASMSWRASISARSPSSAGLADADCITMVTANKTTAMTIC